MAEMDDYSGPFKPDLAFDDFSKEFLLKLMTLWQFSWFHMSGAWYDAIRARFGFHAANDCCVEAYKAVAERVHPRYAKLANYQPTTVREAMKGLQLGPDNSTGGLFPCEYEFKSENHVIMTVIQCRTLLSYEREAPEMIYPSCHVLEKAMLERHPINPDIRVTPLRLPPRNSPEDIACQWEFRLQE